MRLAADPPASAPIFRKAGIDASLYRGGWGLRRNASQPHALCGAVTSDDRLGVFRPTKDGADKPSRFAKLGRVFARLVVTVRLAFRRPTTSPMHATHGPATNGGRLARLPGP